MKGRSNLLRLTVLCLVLRAGITSGIPSAPEPIQGAKHHPLKTIVQGEGPFRHPQKILNTGLDVHLELEHIFTGEDPEGVIRIGKIDRFTADAQGHVYLSEGANDAPYGCIGVFHEDGSFIRGIGKKGQGPGELFQPVNFQVLPDGRLMVLDARNYRTTYYDIKGNYQSSHGWSLMRLHLFYADNECYITRERGEAVLVKSYTHRGERVKTLFEYKDRELIRSGQFWGTLPFVPCSIVVSDPGASRLYHCQDGEYRIEVYDKSGNKIRVIERDYHRVPLTSSFIQAYCDNLKPDPNAPVQPPIGQIMKRDVHWPSHFPAIADLSVDDQGRLWVKTYEVKKGGTESLHAFDVFNREGAFMARVWLGLPSEKHILIVGDKLYTLEMDEEMGMDVLKRYRIVWLERN